MAFEPVSSPLEDQIPVHYKLVGTAKWFASEFEPGSYDPEQVIVISDSGDLADGKRWLALQLALGVDTETTGKFVKKDKGYSMNPVNEGTRLVLLQIGTEELVLLIDPALADEFKEILEGTANLKILQNALYDFKWLLTKKRIHLDRMYDTIDRKSVV